MRIILRYCSHWGNFITQGIDIEPDTDVSKLNEIISEKFEIPQKLQILRFKNEGIAVFIFLYFCDLYSKDKAYSWLAFKSLWCS